MDALAYALRCDTDALTTWDSEARRELAAYRMQRIHRRRREGHRHEVTAAFERFGQDQRLRSSVARIAGAIVPNCLARGSSAQATRSIEATSDSPISN